MADDGHFWNPRLYIGDPSLGQDGSNKYSFIILNSPIKNIPMFEGIINQASYIICADGGANQLKAASERNPGVFFPLPDLIHGDLDSLTEETRKHFESRGVQVLEDPDQYSTDFTKCLKYLSARSVSNDVVVWGSLDGRVDQALSQIHHLYMAIRNPDLKNIGDIYLLTRQNISFLLRAGKNTIQTPLKDSGLSESIGILPVGIPAIITTKGLEWDVTDWHTAFGHQLSTSNHIKSDIIEIETNEPVLLTIELARG